MNQRLHALAGAVLAAAVVVATPLAAAAAQAPASQSAPGQAKKYRATSAVVVDKATGQRRLPSEQEVTEMVATLTTLTARNENPVQTATSTGAVGAELTPGFGGLILGRATEEGTYETRCVFTFEEGAAFLGLVADVQ